MNTDTTTSTEPLWAEGPTLQHITDEGGTYWVNPDWRERYLQKAAALSKNMDRLVEARNLHPQTSMALNVRDRARAVHGVSPVSEMRGVSPADAVRNTNRYWPTDSIGLPGTLLHFQLIDELTQEDQLTEIDAVNAQYIPRCPACQTQTRLLGDLCEDCHAALRFVQYQHDELKAREMPLGERGLSRAQLVAPWLRM